MKTRKTSSVSVRAGIDTGGTFTDFVFEADGQVGIFKLASTPDDPSRAITEGLQRIADETGSSMIELEVVHGTTVGTNALLQRRGASVALVTTAGFEDVIEIGRQARPERPPSGVGQIRPLADLRHPSLADVTAMVASQHWVAPPDARPARVGATCTSALELHPRHQALARRMGAAPPERVAPSQDEINCHRRGWGPALWRRRV